MRFELMTSSLPRKRSTPALAWKANALPTELLPHFLVPFGRLRRWTSHLRSVVYGSKLLPSSLVRLEFIPK